MSCSNFEPSTKIYKCSCGCCPCCCPPACPPPCHHDKVSYSDRLGINLETIAILPNANIPLSIDVQSKGCKIAYNSLTKTYNLDEGYYLVALNTTATGLYNHYLGASIKLNGVVQPESAYTQATLLALSKNIMLNVFIYVPHNNSTLSFMNNSDAYDGVSTGNPIAYTNTTAIIVRLS